MYVSAQDFDINSRIYAHAARKMSTGSESEGKPMFGLMQHHDLLISDLLDYAVEVCVCMCMCVCACVYMYVWADATS